MSVRDLANVLAIHDKVIRLIGEDKLRDLSLGTKVSLQDAGPLSLRWSDAALKSFLEGAVRSKFGVTIKKKNIKATLNGLSATIGDLSIAIFAAIQREQRPRQAESRPLQARSPIKSSRAI